MRKFRLFIGAMALCATVAHARTIVPTEAMHIAATYSSHTASPAKRIKALSFNAQPTLIYTERQDGEDLFYVFNRPGQGYIIVAADDKCESVLAYSDTKELTDFSTVPDNMRAWLGEYARQVKAAKASTTARAPRHNARSTVSPLLTTKWGQMSPYNDDCPEVVTIESTEGRTTKAVTGCVATAISQLMKYYRHPQAPKGDLHYVWEHTDRDLTETVTRRFTGHTYDWDNILDNYNISDATEDQKAAVATLVADAAYAMEMQFGEFASESATMLIPFAMNTYFGYDASAIYEERDFHDNAEWEDLICDELEARRPVIYSGTTASNVSHTWIIDGTDGKGMYHINWGWEGWQDGYFLLTGTDILAPEPDGIGGSSTKESYDIYQAAILGMKPDAGGKPRVDFVSMDGESLSEDEIARPLTIAEDMSNIWLSMYGNFCNHSNRGTDRYCEFALRFTNVATGESNVIMMPIESPILMQSLMVLEHIDIPKTELQFMPSGDYDVEAVFRAYTVKVVGGEMQFVGDETWMPFRHLHGAPVSQRIKLSGTVPGLYLTTPVENTVPTLDHMIFKATLHANEDTDTYLIPLLFEAASFDESGVPKTWQANMQRQSLPSTHVQMRAGETKTFWFGEWQYLAPASQIPQLMLLQMALSPDPDGDWSGYNLLPPNYYNQSIFIPTPATAIAQVHVRDSRQGNAVYSLSGQRVANSGTSGLKPGIYIIGGRKVAVK